MHESWMQRLLKQTGLLGGLIAMLDVQWRAASCRLRAIRKNLLVALCMAAIGFILVGISLIALAVMLVAVWWRDYPLHALGGLSVLYASIGGVLIQRALRRIG